MKKITDKDRMDWLIECGFIKWLGIDEAMFGVRKAIDAAIISSRDNKRTMKIKEVA